MIVKKFLKGFMAAALAVTMAVMPVSSVKAAEVTVTSGARQGACESCPVGAMRGANVTCQDFARQFPEKMVSLLQEMDKKGSTFYEEYCTRFPECNIPIEDLAHVACRKVLFEGFIFCEKTDDMSACIACWNEKYKGDITVTDMDEYNGENYTMSVESTHE
jgi:hypothetical protein